MENYSSNESDIAIIGISCITAGSVGRHQFWRNILKGTPLISDVPSYRWDIARFFSTNRRDRDKICSSKGGFMPAVPFDAIRFGMPADQVHSTEPLQLLSLEVVGMTLEDAGYGSRPFNRDRTAVIVGTGGGLGELEHRYIFRTYLTQYFDGKIPEDLLEQLPKWNKDSLPGILPSVTAGRIANRFGFGGPNFVTDAACASSLTALHMGVRELNAGTSDTAIIGGADTYNGPFTYLSFGRTQALSESGNCRPFDVRADGTVLGEGVGFIMIKRLADARRDGDRIYACAKGLGGASDGRGKGLTAPNIEGQVRALQRAYQSTGISPETIELIETHGTGTAVGDVTEIESLMRVFSPNEIKPNSIPIGSVKSIMGHTKNAAGIISLIKTVLALYYKTIPPTGGIDNPIPILKSSPFFPNLTARPWIHSSAKYPRRAAVSAFGFGGTDYHAILEEFTGTPPSPMLYFNRPAEMFLFRGETSEVLVSRMKDLKAAIENRPKNDLFEAARTSWVKNKDGHGPTLTIVAGSIEELFIKLEKAIECILANQEQSLPEEVYFYSGTRHGGGSVAFLFPGQGSQYPDMFAESAIYFEEIGTAFERADTILLDKKPNGISRIIFPASGFTPEEKKKAIENLSQTDIAQPALGACEMGVYNTLKSFDIMPDFVAGHSYGEYVALCAAGVIDEETLYKVSEARGAIIREKSKEIQGVMAAAQTDPETVTQALSGLDTVWISNINAPRQTVISGSIESIAAAADILAKKGIDVTRLAVACAFHSPLVAPARDEFSNYLKGVSFNEPVIPVFSNVTGKPYPPSKEAIRAMLGDHLVNGVDFVKEIKAMYAAGARIFIECGPRNVLSNLTGKIIDDREAIIIAIDSQGGGGYRGMLRAIAQIAACGLPVNFGRLFDRCEIVEAVARAGTASGRPVAPKDPAWMVDGGMAWPTGGLPGDSGQRPMVNPLRIDNLFGQSVPDMPDQTGKKSDSTPFPVGNSELLCEILERQRGLTKKMLELHDDVLRAFKGSVGPTISLPPLENGDSDASLFTSSRFLSSQQESAQASNALHPAESTTSTVLNIVSERTGYQKDLLDLEANLEADLGIDSIKRTEISGAIRTMYPKLSQQGLQALSRARSLRTMIDVLENDAAEASGPADTAAPKTCGDEQGERKTVARFRLETHAAGPLSRDASLIPGVFVLITSDESGLADRIASQMRTIGVKPIVLVPIGSAGGEGLIAVDWLNVSSLSKTIEAQMAGGTLAGVLHCASLKASTAFSALTFTEWKERTTRDCKSLLSLAQASGPFLNAAIDAGAKPFFIGIVRDSVLTTDLHPDKNAPWHGGVVGFINSLAMEWPAIHCRTIDIGSCPGAQLVQCILSEIEDRGEERLIAYKGLERFSPKIVNHPHGKSAAHLTIGPDSVIIITGGARGITSEIAHEFASRFKPKLLLVGRSPYPETESANTAGITEKMELTKILAEQGLRAGKKLTIKEIERAYARLCAGREIARTVSALRQSGAQVRYRDLDLTTEAAVDELLETALKEYGRIDGIIHGAGIVEDSHIMEKNAESYSRVLDTKADSAFLLCRALKKIPIRFAVFFSSVARLGSAGQADYAAGNEIVDLIASGPMRYLDSRVVSISWGPWLNRGMTEKLDPSVFEDKGCEAIRCADGRAWAVDEVIHGALEDRSIILGNGPWSATE